MSKASYVDYIGIHNAIALAGGYKASAYYVPGQEIVPCALMMDHGTGLWVNYLPTTGYGHSEIREEELNRNVFLLKHLPVEYARAVFWETEKNLIYVDLQRMEEQYCRIISWEPCGNYSIFKVQLENEDTARELRASEYGNGWVFLDPET